MGTEVEANYPQRTLVIRALERDAVRDKNPSFLLASLVLS